MQFVRSWRPKISYHVISHLSIRLCPALPPGSHDSLSLWVSPAPYCQEGPNVNMLLHLDHLPWSTT